MPRKRQKYRTEKAERDANQIIRDYYEKRPEEDVDLGEEEPSVIQDRVSARSQLDRKAAERLAESQELSGGDPDAAWPQAVHAGEEAVGGSTPTPDQDIVDKVGEGAGVTYQDAEPLEMDEKLAERDSDRWELDPASSEDYQERQQMQGKEKRKKQRKR